MLGNGFRVLRDRKARPSTARVERGVAAKEHSSASRARIFAGLVVLRQRAGPGPLGAFLPENLVLLRRELGTPFSVRFLNFVDRVCHLYVSFHTFDPLESNAVARWSRVVVPGLSVMRSSRTLSSMEVHFTPEQEAQLAQIAAYAGSNAEILVKDAALRLIEGETEFRAAVREGIAQADRGEFVEEEEMNARFERTL